MTIEYVVRVEDGDLVCHLIVDRSDYVEIHRIPGGCQHDDPMLCAMLIEVCQIAAERDAGQLLPWVWPADDAPETDPRVCWTTDLVRVIPQ